MAREGRPLKESDRRDEITIAVVALGLALAVRAAFLVSPHAEYDFESWRIVAGIVERGGNVYRETNRYNYSPLWSLVLLGLDGLSRAVGLSFARTISLFLLLVDACIAALVRAGALARGRIPAHAWLASALFFANPVSVLVSSSLGAFDNFSILFLLMALFWAESRRSSEGRVAASL